MALLRVRLDDRLLHSEVVYGELEAATFDRVVVAAPPEALGRVEGTALAPSMRLSRVAPEALAAALDPEAPTLVVLSTVEDLAAAMRAGFRPPAVILANRARRAGTQPLSASYHVDAGELERIAALIGDGVTVVAQRIPAQPPVPVDRARVEALRAGWGAPEGPGGPG